MNIIEIKSNVSIELELLYLIKNKKIKIEKNIEFFKKYKTKEDNSNKEYNDYKKKLNIKVDEKINLKMIYSLLNTFKKFMNFDHI